MTRKKTAQALSVIGTTTVLSALIMNERFWLVAMIAGMRIVALNSTELDLYKHSVSAVQSSADLHSRGSTVYS